MSIRILHGDCRDVLKTLPNASVQCCVTSPPYWGLRDYGVDGQIGMERTYQEHIAVLVEVFREVRRVLRQDGTLWLNYGDCYATSVNGRSAADTKAAGNDDRTFRDKPFSTIQGALKPKDLVMMPARVAIALQEDGWWLRSDIIWAKPNPMPESITDRPATSHEHVFLLAKAARYFYDAEVVREARASNEDAITFRGDCYVGGATDNTTVGKRGVVGNKRVKVPGGWDQGPGAHGSIHRSGRTEATYQEADISSGRNCRNVWTIASQPFSEAHFATFPPDLAERCILAGTSERGCCSSCGAPWTRVTTKGEPDMAHRLASGADVSGGYNGQSTKNHDAHGIQNASDVKRRILEGMREKTYSWRPSCRCDAAVIPCVVLDPFSGAGTALMVADRTGRDAIGIELNRDYIDISTRRVTKDAGMFADIVL